jgi:hypothetical protein
MVGYWLVDSQEREPLVDHPLPQRGAISMGPILLRLSSAALCSISRPPSSNQHEDLGLPGLACGLWRFQMVCWWVCASVADGSMRKSSTGQSRKRFSLAPTFRPLSSHRGHHQAKPWMLIAFVRGTELVFCRTTEAGRCVVAKLLVTCCQIVSAKIPSTCVLLKPPQDFDWLAVRPA